MKYIFDLIFKKENNQLILDYKTLNDDAKKFEEKLIKLIGDDNKVFIPLILINLPNMSYNERYDGDIRYYTIDIEKNEIKYFDSLSNEDIDYIDRVLRDYGFRK